MQVYFWSITFICWYNVFIKEIRKICHGFLNLAIEKLYYPHMCLYLITLQKINHINFRPELTSLITFFSIHKNRRPRYIRLKRSAISVSLGRRTPLQGHSIGRFEWAQIGHWLHDSAGNGISNLIAKFSPNNFFLYHN